MLSYILPFIALIVVVVFIHEYGHYYFAKRYGVGVTDFSIGFGKEMFGWNDKSGTRWKVCVIPLGGYVKFFGDRNVYSQADNDKIIKEYSKEDQDKLFVLKPLYQRALIVFGGPLANFLLAILIFFSVYTFFGKDFTPAVINEVQKDSPAMVAGLKDNDIVVSIDGNEVTSIMDVSKYIMMSTDEFINFTVNRFDQDLTFRVKPNIVEGEDNLGNKISKRMVGIKLGAYNNEVNHVKLGPTKALFYAVNEVYYVSTSSLKYIGSMLTGNGDTSQLGGPIRIAKISGQVAEFGILPFISLMAYISISLGLINLFPIPMLDGGHLMFYGIEKVLGRPLSQKTQEGFFRIGMFLLLSLMFFTTFNDLKDVGLFKFFNNYIS
ncbi:RIP metalloprotease RseP [Candidatus Pelagibacter ubique]|jgi:regulator of sigma E protease|uniref:Zinc metalloprotease n=1 Tax=Pelagibacter ubique (strain HTCC1062) TaxID=335992 RepID=Q4FMF6_PELUB|nr:MULTISPECIES: RIP metalloprotease RseP [Pelagibacter]MDA9135345.1 RIP metalloprotease RseP [bacterium]AAZ21633.1 membrane-associated zinc metalloprotease [Candidatus Pelagibacter ubique HTCC1062]MDA7468849.1 RIP metalloprotease RseP [Candidatus Pelagibacter ubique]MDA7477629.1 RIP metalloprotease RseP [Candidatus Pelagibacter ubique]MDA7478207.1 RIP metalloprotease RseP [Candidatus Pelagibacter ubique]